MRLDVSSVVRREITETKAKSGPTLCESKPQREGHPGVSHISSWPRARTWWLAFPSWIAEFSL